jgi:hypothetical protein
MSDKVPPAQRKLALQYRTGSMWNPSGLEGRALPTVLAAASPTVPSMRVPTLLDGNFLAQGTVHAIRDGSAEICFVDAISPADAAPGGSLRG